MAPLVPQAAVIPIREDGRVCILTSRRGGRWVFPKGRIEHRQTAAEAALVEAWEEAGLRGELTGDSVGHYRYKKNGRTHHVTVFVMRVTAEESVFPELGERDIDWVTPDEAANRVEEKELKQLVRGVFAAV